MGEEEEVGKGEEIGEEAGGGEEVGEFGAKLVSMARVARISSNAGFRIC